MIHFFFLISWKQADCPAVSVNAAIISRASQGDWPPFPLPPNPSFPALIMHKQKYIKRVFKSLNVSCYNSSKNVFISQKENTGSYVILVIRSCSFIKKLTVIVIEN